MATTLVRINERRKNWLDLAKEMVETAARRNAKFDDVCPDSHIDDEERRETLKDITALSARIEELSSKMADLETEDEAVIGAAALLGAEEVTTDLRVCVALLVVKGLSDSVRYFTHSVGAILDFCCCRNPEQAVELRCAFRIGGVMRPHVHMLPSLTVEDMGDVRLKEQAFADILFIKPDQGCALMAVTGVLGK